jgi:hypothetical protein
MCEATLLQFALTAFDTSQYRNIFKMTGRYKLTDSFQKDVWMVDGPVGCLTNVYTTSPEEPVQMHTFFYKLTQPDLPLFKSCLQTMGAYDAIELVLYKRLESRMTCVSEIGIEVRWACFDCIRVF